MLWKNRTLRITADADTGLLCRVGGVLATLDLLPKSFHFRFEAEADDVTIEIVVVGATARQVDLLRRKLAQMTLISAVE